MERSNEDLQVQIRTVLERFPEVVLGIFFGSHSRYEAGPRSDVDIAVTLIAESDSKLSEIMLELQRVLKTDAIDLVNLRRASIPLAYRIFRDGIILVCRDELLRQRLMVSSISKYLDLKPLRDRMFEVAKKIHATESP